MRVLYVEDSQRLQRTVGEGLRRAGYAVDVVGDGTQALWMARGNAYDVIVLDLMLPGKDGLSVLREIRAGGGATHVLVLSAKDTIADRVAGLRAGADDYLVKPFAFDELLARVEALARRQHGIKQPLVVIGGLSLDISARTVSRGDMRIDLSPREYALLEYLAMRKGCVVSRTEIEQHIYDDRAEPMSNVVDAAIYALRRKLEAAGEPALIQTRRGSGYVLQAAP